MDLANVKQKSAEIATTELAQPDTIGDSIVSKWQITAKGRGRVKPRKGQIAQKGYVPRIANLSQVDIEHGEKEGDPKPRFQERMINGWIDYVALDSPQAVYKALGKIRDNQPVNIRGSSLVTELVDKLDFQYLKSMEQTRSSDQSIPILCSFANRHRFYEFDSSKNLPTLSHYYVRESETHVLQMSSLKEFVDCAKSWKERKLMLRASAQQVGLNSLLEDCVDWNWLSGFLSSQKYGSVRSIDIEAGTGNALLPAKYDVHDVLIAQVAGRRRYLLLPPNAAFTGAHPYPIAHAYDKYCMVDLENPDTSRWPQAVNISQGLVCVTRPGDVLHVPKCWFIHCQDLEAENISLKFTIHNGSKVSSKEALKLILSRAIEERCADVVGPESVRTWLHLTAKGKELSALDLSTVAGYKRVVMCQGIRDECDAVLGVPGMWSEFLKAMCVGRLLPTTWLNKEKPLLLLPDTPMVYEDTRTEEEKKYPALFRRKLEAEGWKVEPTVSTVPIPGYNVPVNYRP